MLIIKVPALNGLGKTKGCEKAPDMIVNALNDVWSSEQGKEINIKDFEIKEIKVDNSNVKNSEESIFNEAKKLFKENKKTIFLGGDHSISYSLAKAFSLCFGNAGLVILDAHADCMQPMKEPNHEEWLKALIEQGFAPENVFLVGSRNIYSKEQEFLKEKKVNLFSANEFVENLQEACEALMEKIKDFDALYLSIDIDVCDPAFAPGTGYREPGGFTSRQLVYIIQKLNLLKNLKAIDIVEVNPEKDLNNMTVKLAARLVAELF